MMDAGIGLLALVAILIFWGAIEFALSWSGRQAHRLDHREGRVDGRE